MLNDIAMNVLFNHPNKKGAQSVRAMF